MIIAYQIWTYFTCCLSVSIVNFEHVNAACGMTEKFQCSKSLIFDMIDSEDFLYVNLLGRRNGKGFTGNGNKCITITENLGSKGVWKHGKLPV